MNILCLTISIAYFVLINVADLLTMSSLPTDKNNLIISRDFRTSMLSQQCVISSSMLSTNSLRIFWTSISGSQILDPRLKTSHVILCAMEWNIHVEPVPGWFQPYKQLIQHSGMEANGHKNSMPGFRCWLLTNVRSSWGELSACDAYRLSNLSATELFVAAKW